MAHLLLKHNGEANAYEKLKGSPDVLMQGELAVTFKEGEEGLYVKNTNDEIVPIGGASEVFVQESGKTEAEAKQGYVLVDENEDLPQIYTKEEVDSLISNIDVSEPSILEVTNSDGTTQGYVKLASGASNTSASNRAEIYTKPQIDSELNSLIDKIDDVYVEAQRKEVTINNDTTQGFIQIDTTIDTEVPIYTKDEVDDYISNLNNKITDAYEAASKNVINSNGSVGYVKINDTTVVTSEATPATILTKEEVQYQFDHLPKEVTINSDSTQGFIQIDTTINNDVPLYTKDEVDDLFNRNISGITSQISAVASSLDSLTTQIDDGSQIWENIKVGATEATAKDGYIFVDTSVNPSTLVYSKEEVDSSISATRGALLQDIEINASKVKVDEALGWIQIDTTSNANVEVYSKAEVDSMFVALKTQLRNLGVQIP